MVQSVSGDQSQQQLPVDSSAIPAKQAEKVVGLGYQQGNSVSYQPSQEKAADYLAQKGSGAPTLPEPEFVGSIFAGAYEQLSLQGNIEQVKTAVKGSVDWLQANQPGQVSPELLQQASELGSQLATVDSASEDQVEGLLTPAKRLAQLTDSGQLDKSKLEEILGLLQNKMQELTSKRAEIELSNPDAAKAKRKAKTDSSTSEAKASGQDNPDKAGSAQPLTDEQMYTMIDNVRTVLREERFNNHAITVRVTEELVARYPELSWGEIRDKAKHGLSILNSGRGTPEHRDNAFMRAVGLDPDMPIPQAVIEARQAQETQQQKSVASSEQGRQYVANIMLRELRKTGGRMDEHSFKDIFKDVRHHLSHFKEPDVVLLNALKAYHAPGTKEDKEHAYLEVLGIAPQKEAVAIEEKTSYSVHDIKDVLRSNRFNNAAISARVGLILQDLFPDLTPTQLKSRIDHAIGNLNSTHLGSQEAREAAFVRAIGLDPDTPPPQKPEES